MASWQRKTIFRTASDKPSVTPEEIVDHLRSIAAALDSAKNPSRSLVLAAITGLIMATDRSLSATIRDAIKDKIIEAVPSEFDSLYDTNPEGKGFKKGYMSFGLQPTSWVAKDLIGGILIHCQYNISEFTSESPGPGVQWQGHSKGGGILEFELSACYYNKRLGGGCDENAFSLQNLGNVVISFDAQENMDEIEVDMVAISTGIKAIINEVLTNPPEAAKSSKSKKLSQPPTTSPKALLNWLYITGLAEAAQSEVEATARAMSERSGRPYEGVLNEVVKYIRGRGFPINPNI